MVLGLRTKNRKNQVDYLIHLLEIKPWPPSQSLRSLRSVLIQWEHGDRNSGSTNSVVPFLGSGVGDGKIEFNESFRLPVTLLREMSIKGGDGGDTFQKNCIEFNLYEPRRDRTVRGQLLGTAVIDLADYGIVKETLSISVPMNCKRNFRNTGQPLLFIKIEPVEKGRTSSSSRDSLSKEALLERNGAESVSALMNEEYAEEAEIASFTDDDVSSHSSLAASSPALESNAVLPPQNEENGSQVMNDCPGEDKEEHSLASKQGLAKSDVKPVSEQHETLKGTSSSLSSTKSSSDLEKNVIIHATSSNLPAPSSSISKKIVSHGVQSSSTSIADEETEEKLNFSIRSNEHDSLAPEIDENVANDRIEISGTAQGSTKESVLNDPSSKVASLDTDSQMNEKLDFANSVESFVNGEDDNKAWSHTIRSMHKIASTDVFLNSSTQDNGRENEENGQDRQFLEEKKNSTEDESLYRLSHDDTRKQVPSGSDAVSFNRENVGVQSNVLNNDRLKHVKSVRSPIDTGRSNGSFRSNQFVEKVKDVSIIGDAQNGVRSFISNERKDAKIYPETRSIYLDSKIQQLEHRIRTLERELRESAAIEVGLYSVVAEHGSSINKVHAPARRLSRFYLHACKENGQPRASAARSAVSGLVLVAKACGNDVPRLTFWLSNCVVLRAIISQASAEQQLQFVKRTGGQKGNNKKSSSLEWNDTSSSKKTRGALREISDDWKDPRAFTSALEKVEAWIFSRIIESVWWQTLTPHMQSTAAKAINGCMALDLSKSYERTSSSGNQELINFSLELWKKAFKDACERLCPVRAGGHECGCLPVLARLIMEQCVARLDVAMFNAILRESDDDIPTDPVSDPISDAMVLPIPTGKASFGAGAQLKNAIGNWSRWLTDLFGIDDDDSLEDENDHYEDDDDGRKACDASLKSFHLLNALSDLMMLPKDMLLSRSIRKEVCPTFGALLIRRVLKNFVPDEFCPDPIPKVVLEALEHSEDPLEAEEGSITNFPCTAAPIVYLSPSAASVSGIIGENGKKSQLRRSGSLVLKKSYTSDDELDELDSPLSSIIDSFRGSPTPTKPSWKSNENGIRNTVRYELLREVWMKSE
ncbi:uncharacterized protein LOC132285959 [Cornus florida]|uniref:uncharacterized protein LOC132285959 n=1 Tax=Cornus florida TaxID=4283 RepID=UPI00289B5120|nr:uncharacterized protein LOC132285959 [Cornus florida]XP_059644184.1 uncharacterized protein LOC132285959 [Cornus florida]